jgi:DNA-directed RNA polymerase specialized sigma subunit
MYGSMGGSTSDPTATQAINRMDGLSEQIERLTVAANERERIVGECLRMLDAMRRELGERYAVVLELYYVDRAPTWSDVAHEMGVSRRAVCRLRDEAYDWVDRSAHVLL